MKVTPLLETIILNPRCFTYLSAIESMHHAIHDRAASSLRDEATTTKLIYMHGGNIAIYGGVRGDNFKYLMFLFF